MSRDRSSPITDWIRLLCRHIRDELGSDGVGIIGMCLTGNFAIQLIGDESVIAAVASQPAMPFFTQGALHMSPADIDKSRQALDSKGPMRLLRFEMIRCAQRQNQRVFIELSMMMASIESKR